MSIEDHDSRASAVDRYAPGRESPANDDSQPEDTGPFFRREKEARGPALALTLFLKNGNRKTVPYHLLIEMDFEPETGIEIYFSSGVKITIKGMHLAKLYDDIAEQRILEIRSMEKLHAHNEHKKSEVTGQPLPLVEDVVIERGVIDVDTGTWKPASGSWNSRNQQWQPSGYLN